MNKMVVTLQQSEPNFSFPSFFFIADLPFWKGDPKLSREKYNTTFLILTVYISQYRKVSVHARGGGVSFIDGGGAT